jgi:hypothetical protein
MLETFSHLFHELGKHGEYASLFMTNSISSHQFILMEENGYDYEGTTIKV